jgi:hypothetical protein
MSSPNVEVRFTPSGPFVGFMPDAKQIKEALGHIPLPGQSATLSFGWLVENASSRPNELRLFFYKRRVQQVPKDKESTPERDGGKRSC